MNENSALHLARWRNDWRVKTEGEVAAVLDRLEEAGDPVTVALVAREARVSRSWLYTSDFADRVRQLRQKVPIPRTPSPRHIASDDSVRARLKDALDDNRRLREENRDLRHQLEIALGAQRLRLM